MAATAWLYEFDIVGSAPVSGAPIVQCRVHMSDPAVSADLQPARVLALLVTLDNSSPNQYTTQVKNAVIAAGAAQVPPFVLNSAAVIIAAFG
jgi:hypothetical protein